MKIESEIINSFVDFVTLIDDKEKKVKHIIEDNAGIILYCRLFAAMELGRMF